MKVILKENIDSLGKKGDIVNIAPGYGRNYLIPKKLALKVTATNMRMIEKEQAALRKGLEKDMASFQSLVQQLNEVTLTFIRKAGDRDAIFGSVSLADIKEALDKLNFNIEKKKILLDDPIKKLGNFTIPIKVFQDERAEVKIEVIKEETAEDKEQKAEAEAPPEEEAQENLVPEEGKTEEDSSPDTETQKTPPEAEEEKSGE
jgi:large subunit ribosomal protein L9